MNWEAVAAISEAVGALAVVLSLLYLAFQIRQNTASMKASGYDSFISQNAILADLLLSNEALGRAWARGLSKPEQLDPLDRQRFHVLMIRFFRIAEIAHRKRANGLIDSDLFEVWSQYNFRYTAREPGAVVWWQANRQFFTAAFRDFTDRELGLPRS